MTKPIKVISRWERFKRFTVWHPLNTDPEDSDRWGPRFWFPSYDVIATILGFYALLLGSPLLNRLFPTELTDAIGILLIVASIVCLFGVCFPRFNYLELTGKLLIVFVLGAYAGTVWFMTGTSDEPNGFVVINLVMSVWLLGPRITKLFTQVPKNPDVIWVHKVLLKRKQHKARKAT